MAMPVLGLIAPPANYPVPAEGLTLYGSAVRFNVFSLGLKSMTPDGFESVIDKIVPAAGKLAAEGANAIVIFGTSLTFYKGADFNHRLMRNVANATRLNTTSMSSAVVDGLRAVAAKRIAVVTAYADEVNSRLQTFLEESGFEVLALKGFGLERIGEAGKINQARLQEFSVDVFRSAPRADALLVSCGGLRTLELLEPLEKACGVPVVSSTPHALWAGVRLLGLTGQVDGFGRVIGCGL